MSISLLLIINFFISINVIHAQDTAIKDFASYNLSVTTDGKTETGSTEQSVLSYDSKSDQFEIKIVTKISGQEEVEEEWIDREELLSASFATSVIANCVSEGAVLETITVPAGKFQTCRVEMGTGQIWFAAVPFGIVKLRMTDSSETQQIELKKFKFGK